MITNNPIYLHFDRFENSVTFPYDPKDKNKTFKCKACSPEKQTEYDKLKELYDNETNISLKDDLVTRTRSWKIDSIFNE